MISRSRNGWASPTTEATTMIAVTADSSGACPRNSPATRRRLTGDSASCALSAGLMRAGPRASMGWMSAICVSDILR